MSNLSAYTAKAMLWLEVSISKMELLIRIANSFLPARLKRPKGKIPTGFGSLKMFPLWKAITQVRRQCGGLFGFIGQLTKKNIPAL